MNNYIGTIVPQHFYVRALYDYQAEDATGLSFRQGDVIQVITQLESGWWDGIIHGVRGWFPSNYCEAITEHESQRLSTHPEDTDYDEFDLGALSDGDDDALDLDVGYREDAVGDLDGVDGRRQGERNGEPDALWIPQATPDGRIFYFNVQTGKSVSTLEETQEAGSGGAISSRLPPELIIGGIRDNDYLRETGYESSSDLEGMSGSRSSLPNKRGSSLSNGVSPATSLESLTLGGSTRNSNSSLLQQVATPRPPAATSFIGTANWTRQPNVSQRLFSGATGVKLTWDRILGDTRRSVERYRQAINDNDRGDIVRRVEDISDHLRLILAAGSGTTDDHFGSPSVMPNNRALHARFREILAQFPNLVLSSHIAAADWSPEDIQQKCLHKSEALLQAVYGYIEVARQQRGEEIPRLFPGFMDNQQAGGAWRNNNRFSVQSSSDMSIGRRSDDESFFESITTLDKSLLDKLEDLRHQIVSGVQALQELLVLKENMIDVQRHRLLSDDICSRCGKVLSLCRPWLAIVESVDLLPAASISASDKELSGFAQRKQRTYNLIGELVVSCQTVAAPLADEWTTSDHPPLNERLARVRVIVEQLDRNAFEVTESLRTLLDLAPNTGSPSNRRSTRMSTSSRSASGSILSNISQAASQADGKRPGRGSDASSRLSAKLSLDRPQSQELPRFLKLEHEGEVVYDTKTDPPVIRGGTLLGLVEQLTRHDRIDTTFKDSFLLTYQSFTTAAQLFELLIKRWSLEPLPGLSREEYAIWVERKQTPIRFRIVNILKTWLDTYWMEGTDQESERLLQRIYMFVKQTVQAFSAAGAKPLLTVIEQRMRGEDVNSRKLVANSNIEAPTPILPKSLTKKNPKIIDIDPLELARQLTIMESTLYRKIKPQECLNKTWSKKEKGPDGQDRAVNIQNLILHSNRVTNWVVFMILAQDKVKERVNIIKYFVAVADKCLYMGNFSTLTAIISAFGAAPIHRLTRTWGQINKTVIAQLEKMRTLMGTGKNFNEYREALHRANPPCIPFFGVYLTDLTFIEDGIHSNIRKTELINFAKRAKTAEVIREIQTYQNVAYPFKSVQELHDIIIPVIVEAPDVNEQYDRSLKLEPREREDEKIARLLSESGFL